MVTETELAKKPAIDTDDWPNRCAYWFSNYQSQLPIRKRREKAKPGLVLTGYGLSIRVDKGRLLIKDGSTHYPQQLREYAYFKGALDIPPRIVVVDGKGSITLDALDWLAEQGVPLIRLKWDGSFSSIVTTGGQAADPDKLAWQVKAQADEAEQLAFAIPLIAEKLANTIETLTNCIPDSRFKRNGLCKITSLSDQLRDTPPQTIRELTAIEAHAAASYFRAWQGLNLPWAGTSKRPIPDEWRVYLSRSSLKGGFKLENVMATHPVNAMLNYLYAVLVSMMQIKAIADGYEPTYGIIHNRRTGKRARQTPSFAFDIMEPMRPVVDRVVLSLIAEEELHPSDLELRTDGVVRVNPELARRLVGED